MAYDEHPGGGIDDILLALEDSGKLCLPTLLTLYPTDTERLIPTSADPSNKPPPALPVPVNLHLSLGGSYTDHHHHHHQNSINSTRGSPGPAPHVHFNNILNASLMMKRSYLEQNNHEMPAAKEIILIHDNNINVAAAGNGNGNGGGYCSKQKYSNYKTHHDGPPDIDWAARSASGNRALLRALHIIKSESSSSSSRSTRIHDDDGADAEVEPRAGGTGIGNSMNPDDFHSISNINCAVNVDVRNPFKDTSTTISSATNPENVIFHTATHHHRHDDRTKSSLLPEPLSPVNPYNYYYYYYQCYCYPCHDRNQITTSNNSSRRNINIAPINIPQGAILGSRKSAAPPPLPLTTSRLSSNSYPPPALMPMMMHFHDTYMSSTNAAINCNATTQRPPPAAAAAGFPFGSINNQWSNGHPLLMKRNEYVKDSQIDMIRQMPTVATDGGIPDGSKIEGFLYRYSKYEDVIIVCFCHGSFFSPKEFVMHAAGGEGHGDANANANANATATATEFQNPMRLITIVPHD